MKATIVIDMDNDAFAGADCGHELARILYKLSERVGGHNEAALKDTIFKILDSNGNKVGRLEIE